MICTWYLAQIPLVIFQTCLKFYSPHYVLLPIFCGWTPRHPPRGNCKQEHSAREDHPPPPHRTMDTISVNRLVTNNLLFTCLHSKSHLSNGTDELDRMNVKMSKMLHNKLADFLPVIRRGQPRNIQIHSVARNPLRHDWTKRTQPNKRKRETHQRG